MQCIQKKYLKKNFQKRIKLFIYLFHILKKDILKTKIFLFRQVFTGTNINLFDFYKRYHDRSFIYSLFMHIKHIMVNNFEIFKNYKKLKNIMKMIMKKK